MLQANNELGLGVYAIDALYGNKYYCPICKESVYLTQGSRRVIDHFSHYPNSTCTHGEGESIEHLTQKEKIYDGLVELLGEGKVSKEETLPDGQRPDVLFEARNGQMVAVEIQRSRISLVDWDDRTASYTDKGIASLWLLNNMKAHLTNLDTFKGKRLEGILRLPEWMRRIATRYGDTAFDQASGDEAGDLVVGVRLKLTSKLVKDSKTGEFVYREGLDAGYYTASSGIVSATTSQRGIRQKLWIPSPHKIGGGPPVKAKSERHRREIAGNPARWAKCDRAVALISDKLPIHQIKSKREAQEAYAGLIQLERDGILDAEGRELGWQIIQQWGDKKLVDALMNSQH